MDELNDKEYDDSKNNSNAGFLIGFLIVLIIIISISFYVYYRHNNVVIGQASPITSPCANGTIYFGNGCYYDISGMYMSVDPTTRLPSDPSKPNIITVAQNGPNVIIATSKGPTMAASFDISTDINVIPSKFKTQLTPYNDPTLPNIIANYLLDGTVQSDGSILCSMNIDVKGSSDGVSVEKTEQITYLLVKIKK